MRTGEQVTGRVRSAFQERRLQSVSDLDLRHASQALFGTHQLAKDASFVAAYLMEVTRRLKAGHPEGLRLARILLRTYLENFAASHDAIQILNTFLKSVQHSLSRQWQQCIKEARLLDMEGGPFHLGMRLLRAENPERERSILGFRGALSACRFMQSAIAAAGQHLSRSAANGAQAYPEWDRYIGIVAPHGRVLDVYAPIAVATFLDPFLAGVEPARLRECVKPLLLASFRDPRTDTSSWPRFAGDVGNRRRDAYLGVVRRWLVSETIDLFFQIIDRHGLDHQWRSRKAFWKRFFDNESVLDASVIFAGRPNRTAQTITKTALEGAALKWGRITKADDPDHAVLLMQMRDVTIAEWSHNGKVRLWHGEDHPDRPLLHSERYTPDQLRRESTFETAHQPPDGWQQKVELQLRRYGIRPD